YFCSGIPTPPIHPSFPTKSVLPSFPTERSVDRESPIRRQPLLTSQNPDVRMVEVVPRGSRLPVWGYLLRKKLRKFRDDGRAERLRSFRCNLLKRYLNFLIYYLN